MERWRNIEYLIQLLRIGDICNSLCSLFDFFNNLLQYLVSVTIRVF